MQSRLIRVLWALSFVLFLATCMWSFVALPESPVTHFGNGGVGDGSMSRGANLTVTLMVGVVTLVGLPLLARLLCCRFPAGINIPNREYWLAPERLAATQRMLVDDMLLLAAWVGCYFAANDVQIVVANTRQPPHLGAENGVLLVVFMLGVVVWVARLYRRYASPSRDQVVGR